MTQEVLRRGGAATGRRAFLTGATAALAACATSPATPDLKRIYANVAQLKDEERRPVITIPGTLGSRLRDRETDQLIWGGPNALSLAPSTDAAIRAIALPIGEPDTPLRALRDQVRPDGVVRTAYASILGAIIQLDIYSGIIRTLIAGGYDFRETREAEIAERDVNLDAFEFPYDWRRDIVEAAQDLAFFIERKREQVNAERRRVLGHSDTPVVFDIVAHSMGTLVARYYLMYGAQDLPEDGSLPELTWEGAKNVGVAVLIAPPNFGSVLSVDNLVNGRSFGPFQPFYHPTLLGTHVSTYQLMPRTRHGRVQSAAEREPLDMFDAQTWKRWRWGLLATDAEAERIRAVLMPDEPDPTRRMALAEAHLAKTLRRARQFQAAMDRDLVYPPEIDVYLVVGGGFQTPATTEIDSEGRSTVVGFEEGDGIVLRASSLADERQGLGAQSGARLVTPIRGERSTLLLPSEHVEITQNPVFGDNLLFWLLEDERAFATLRAPRTADVPGPIRRAARGVAATVMEGAEVFSGER
jgi:pimeloyl-ACP methyl ester carboxylesterase